MKLLVISPSHIYPPLKGYQNILTNHIDRLATRHSIDLITFYGSSEGSCGADPITSLCNSVEVIRLPKWKMAINLFSGIFSSDPFQVCLYRSKDMTQAVEGRLRSSDYDAVICLLTRTIQFLPEWYQGVKLLNMVDPLVLNYSRSMDWRPWYLRIALKWEISRLYRYELKQSLIFKRILLISRADIADYQELFKKASFEHVQYGVDTEYFAPDLSINRVPGMIIISGNMSYPPNIDGINFFCREIFPLILARVPEAHLWLVGANPSHAIKKLGNDKNISVTGRVVDIRLYLRRAMVSVCPIRLNVGTQTKVLEALSTGVPVVTTSAGNQGIAGQSGRHLYVADSPSEIANYVVSLLLGDKWELLSKSGRQFAQDNFQWTRSAEKIELILHDLLNGTQKNNG